MRERQEKKPRIVSSGSHFNQARAICQRRRLLHQPNETSKGGGKKEGPKNCIIVVAAFLAPAEVRESVKQRVIAPKHE